MYANHVWHIKHNITRLVMSLQMLMNCTCISIWWIFCCSCSTSSFLTFTQSLTSNPLLVTSRPSNSSSDDIAATATVSCSSCISRGASNSFLLRAVNDKSCSFSTSSTRPDRQVLTPSQHTPLCDSVWTEARRKTKYNHCFTPIHRHQTVGHADVQWTQQHLQISHY